MTVDPEQSSAIAGRLLGWQPPACRFLDVATPRDIQAIRRGVFVVYAVWSGQAHASMPVIGRLLRDSAVGANFEVVIANTDGMPEIYDLPEFKRRIHGYAEAAFICGGTIRSVVAPFRIDEFRGKLATFLDQCSSEAANNETAE